MNAAVANLLNAISLIVIGTWGYVDSWSPTALIPAGFGIALAAMFPGVQKHNKTVAHIAVGLTLLVFLALFMPLKGAIGRGETMSIVRVSVMMLFAAMAMVFFVKSFIDARKAREQEAAGTSE